MKRYIPIGLPEKLSSAYALIGLGKATYDFSTLPLLVLDGLPFRQSLPELIMISNFVPDDVQILEFNPNVNTKKVSLVQNNKFEKGNIIVVTISIALDEALTEQSFKDNFVSKTKELFAKISRVATDVDIFTTATRSLNLPFQPSGEGACIAIGKIKTTQTRDYNPLVDLPELSNYKIYDKNQPNLEL